MTRLALIALDVLWCIVIVALAYSVMTIATWFAPHCFEAGAEIICQ